MAAQVPVKFNKVIHALDNLQFAERLTCQLDQFVEMVKLSRMNNVMITIHIVMTDVQTIAEFNPIILALSRLRYVSKDWFPKV
jgi:hypothetical protein